MSFCRLWSFGASALDRVMTYVSIGRSEAARARGDARVCDLPADYRALCFCVSVEAGDRGSELATFALRR